MKTPDSPSITRRIHLYIPFGNKLVRTIGLVCAVSWLLGSCSVSNDPFSLQGKIDGLQDGDSVFLLILTDPVELNAEQEAGGRVFDDTLTTIVTDGQFKLSGQAPATVRDARLVFGQLGPRAPSLSLFLEPGDIIVNGQLDSAYEASVTGTRNNDLMTAHRAKEQQLYAGLRSIQELLRDETLTDQELSNLDQETARIREQVRQNRIDFIREHPDSYAAPTYLRLLEDNLDLDTLEQLYEELDAGVKQTRFARGTAAKIEARRRTAIGQPAPVFSGLGHQGDSVHLEDYEGRYVLIDFWASWCIPCRAEHPHLREAYALYQDRGFDILGVSLDDNRDRWIAAIEEDQLSWMNVSELKGFGDPIARLYGVQPIPDNFLVDPDGIIIARRLRGEQLRDTLAHLLGE